MKKSIEGEIQYYHGPFGESLSIKDESVTTWICDSLEFESQDVYGTAYSGEMTVYREKYRITIERLEVVE